MGEPQSTQSTQSTQTAQPGAQATRSFVESPGGEAALPRLLLEAAPDAMVLVRADGKIAMYNGQLAQLFGYDGEELRGQPIEVLVPERFRGAHTHDRRAYFSEPRRRPMGAGLELFARRRDGTEFLVEISLSPIRVDGALLVMAAIRDISDRKLVETRLRASLNEKEILLKEIHHRVKNNLQIVSSMLSLQMKQVSDAHSMNLFKETQNRVHSIALFHEKLYESRDLARVDIAPYLVGVARSALAAYGVSPESMDLAVDASNVPLSMDAAIATGLIVNELVSNALKHAFRGHGGRILVSLRPEGDDVVLEVADDGAGFPPDIDFRHPKTLGLKLVAIFADQLQGTMGLAREQGTRIVVRFRQEGRR